jgi:cobalt/nickel transport system permease protein
MKSVLPVYRRGDSAWHRMDPRLKLVAVVLLLVATAAIRHLDAALLSLGLCVSLLVTARLPVRWWLDRLVGIAAFLLLVAIVLPFTAGPRDWDWGFFYVSSRGVELALIFMGKALSAAALGLFLLGTAPFETTLHAATALKLPSPLVQVLLITWRYVQVMYQTILDFRIALRLRGFRNRVRWRTYRTISGVIGTLLVQGFDHAERVAQAMRCRGYQGRVATLEEFHIRGKDVLLSLLLLTGGILVVMTETRHYLPRS